MDGCAPGKGAGAVAGTKISKRGAEALPLFDRIGGMKTLINGVDVFYDMVLADPMLAPFFEGVDQARQRIKQVCVCVRVCVRERVGLVCPWGAQAPRRRPRRRTRSAVAGTPCRRQGIDRREQFTLPARVESLPSAPDE
jgi:hypothetical protein